MNKKIGFIGCGKMASAIIQGLGSTDNITGSEVTEEAAKSAAERLGIKVISDNKELAKNSDVIFIATKPNYVKNVLEEIKSELTKDKLVVSIAAGVKTEKIENIIGEIRVIRVMPNTPAMVGEGMSGIAKGKFASDGDAEFVKSLLSSVGKCIPVDESQIDIVTAISGSGPAFYYQVINAMAKAGEKLGLDYEKSLLLSAQTALGSAKMIMASDKSPEELIASVATKGGCTQIGADYLVEHNVDDLFFGVIKNTALKAQELGR